MKGRGPYSGMLIKGVREILSVIMSPFLVGKYCKVALHVREDVRGLNPDILSAFMSTRLMFGEWLENTGSRKGHTQKHFFLF